MASGGGGGGTTTQKSEPWDEQKPYLIKGFEQAGDLYNQGPAQYYPGQTYVDMSIPTQVGLGAATQRATQGSEVTGNASNYAAQTLGGQSDNPWAPLLGAGASGMMDTASGQYLNSNPYLDDVYAAASSRVKQDFEDSVLPGIAAQFGMSGGAGSALHGESLAKAGGQLTDSLGQLSANIYGGDYQQERGRQTQAQQGLTSAGQGLYGTGVQERLQALGLSPDLARAEYADFDKLRDIGQEYEKFGERVLEDDIRRFNYAENADLASLQDYMSLISGNYGGTSVSRTSGGGGSPLASGLGAASLIASLF